MADKEIIARLRTATETLMAQHEAARREIARLQDANAGQARKIRALEEQAKEDRNEIARLQLGAGLGSSAKDKSAARAQVNRLLREVDKCIALISSENV